MKKTLIGAAAVLVIVTIAWRVGAIKKFVFPGS